MSFSAGYTNVRSADDITIDRLGENPSAEHVAQFNAAKAAAVSIIESGSVGTGCAFNVTVSGHANATPSAYDSASCSVTRAPEPVAG